MEQKQSQRSSLSQVSTDTHINEGIVCSNYQYENWAMEIQPKLSTLCHIWLYSSLVSVFYNYEGGSVFKIQHKLRSKSTSIAPTLGDVEEALQFGNHKGVENATKNLKIF